MKNTSIAQSANEDCKEPSIYLNTYGRGPEAEQKGSRNPNPGTPDLRRSVSLLPVTALTIPSCPYFPGAALSQSSAPLVFPPSSNTRERPARFGERTEPRVSARARRPGQGPSHPAAAVTRPPTSRRADPAETKPGARRSPLGCRRGLTQPESPRVRRGTRRRPRRPAKAQPARREGGFPSGRTPPSRPSQTSRNRGASEAPGLWGHAELRAPAAGTRGAQGLGGAQGPRETHRSLECTGGGARGPRGLRGRPPSAGPVASSARPAGPAHRAAAA